MKGCFRVNRGLLWQTGVILLGLWGISPAVVADSVASKTLGQFTSAGTKVTAERIVKTGEVIWSFFFLGEEQIFLCHRSGRMALVDLKKKSVQDVSGGPTVVARGQGGLLDCEPHPQFEKNQLVYFTYAGRGKKGNTTQLGRARLKGTTLAGRQLLFSAKAERSTSHHFGSRLVFEPDGKTLFMTVGDRGARDLAQDLSSHAGKVLRLTHKGKPAANNPFLKVKKALPEIYSYGHRNPQGLARHPNTGAIWESEHGPKGGDEINLIQPGKNYGWPVITYGWEYSGGKVGRGISQKKGMQQPVKYYVPSIAPSGLVFYTGQIKPWQGNLFSGALVLTHLNRITFKGSQATGEERLLESLSRRIRSLEQGPDGWLYVGTDQGEIIRLSSR